MALSDCEETIYFMQMTQAQIENFADSAFYNKGGIIEIKTNWDKIWTFLSFQIEDLTIFDNARALPAIPQSGTVRKIITVKTNNTAQLSKSSIVCAPLRVISSELGTHHGETETFEAAPTSENYSAPNWKSSIAK